MCPWRLSSSAFLKKCGFDVGDMSVINEEIDSEFQELFAQISSETTK